MEISFYDIKPYLRFVRYMHLDQDTVYAPFIPYDARLFYTLDGESVIVARGVSYPMKKGDLIFINSGVDYHIKTPERAVSYLAVNFDFTFDAFQQSVPIHPAILGDFDRQKLVSHVSFTDATAFNEVFYLGGFASIEQRLLSMEKEFSQKLQMYELRLSASMAELLVKCYRHQTTHSFTGADRETAGLVISYVQDNLHRALSNAEIATHFHYHPNYISSLIRRYTGHPLHQYIKNLRIAKAADLLSSTDTPIGEIAVLCGFYDTSHLIRCFKLATGVTPQQYRVGYQ